jgi:hypothetical protein
MRLPRFTIAGLMGLVVVVAVGVAALRFASDLWADILLVLTLGTLGAAVLAFHERTGAKRSWWRGFALFGWGYVALALGPWASESIAPRLPTTMGLDALYARMHPTDEGGQARGDVTYVLSKRLAAFNASTGAAVAWSATPHTTARTFALWMANATPEFFRRVGHCLWALLVACVGGVVGRAFHARGERATV